MPQSLEGNSMQDDLLTVEQVAERLQLKPTTIRSWLRDGSLKGFKIAPKVWRVRESDFQSWIDERENK